MAIEYYVNQLKANFNKGYDKVNSLVPGSGKSVPINTLANVVFHGMAIYLAYNAYQERSVMFTMGGLIGMVGSVPTIGMRNDYSKPIAAKPYQDLSNQAIGLAIKGIYLLAMSAALYSFSVVPKKTALCVGIVSGALAMDAVLVAGVWFDKGTLSHIRSVRERVSNFIKPLFGKDDSKS